MSIIDTINNLKAELEIEVKKEEPDKQRIFKLKEKIILMSFQITPTDMQNYRR